MSVPKSQRKQSSVEYITILQNIEVKLISFNESENRYIPFFTEHLCKLAAEAYDNATLFFEISKGTVRGVRADKIKAGKNAVWSIRKLSSQFTAYIRLRGVENKATAELSHMNHLLGRAAELISAQIPSDDKPIPKQVNKYNFH